MKKFFKIFFFLTLITALLVPVGYVVYHNIFIIPHDKIGFLRDYTKGIEDKKLQPGLHWRFSGFIPNKWQLIILPDKQDLLDVEFDRKIRFAEFFPELEELFRINMQIVIEYSYIEEKIPSLLKKFQYKRENIEDWLRKTAIQIIENNFLKFQNYDSTVAMQEELESFMESKEEGNFFYRIQKKLQERKIAIVISDVFVDSIQFPDEKTYQLQIEKIDSIFAAKIQAEVNRTLEGAKIRAKQKEYQLNIEEAKEALKLIDKQPLVLEYFKYRLMNPNADIVVLDTKQLDYSDLKKYYTKSKKDTKKRSAKGKKKKDSKVEKKDKESKAKEKQDKNPSEKNKPTAKEKLKPQEDTTKESPKDTP